MSLFNFFKTPSIRYRLFLWVSSLFFLTALIGSFLQSYVTKHALKKAQHALYEKILHSKENLRKNLEEFACYEILENQAQIDVLLSTIAFSSPELAKFAPTIENKEQGTWMACADLLHANRWIDFIQNSNEGVSTALIIPESPPFKHAYRIPIDADLSWVFSLDSKTPMIGVRLFPIAEEYPSIQLDGEEIEEPCPIIPETYLLFSLKATKESQCHTIKIEPASLSPPWIQGHDISLRSFVCALERACQAIKQQGLKPPSISQEQIAAHLSKEGAWEEMLINPFPHVTMLALESKEQFLQEKMNDLSMRNGEINILWLVRALLNTNILEGFSPSGVATFKTGLFTGPTAALDQLFRTQKVFDDALYFSKNTPTSPQSSLASGLAVIHPRDSTHVYLGNTANFNVKETSDGHMRSGYLTIGCDIDKMMQRLVLTLRQAVFLVSNEQLLTGFSSDGGKIGVGIEDQQLLKGLLGQSMGVATYQGKEFFFMQLTPFHALDLHFFLLNPVEKEFALLHSLEEGSQKIAHSIQLNVQISGIIVLCVAIFLLNLFSKSITAPIVQLAETTKSVKEGRLDEISLPSTKSKDEIATLCQSFDEMVQGLKEKEKVKGILNKVVSDEIAQEILKGQIHLGGEEKRVTVLFADIRSFTAMTQDMLPSAVIDLLNTCMTKVSASIDHYGGCVDKFIGDEVMALFGAPIAKEDSALQAIRSALEMINVLREWNKEREASGQERIEMGVGIHTGTMLVGNMGAENRLNYTVIGSNVNLASRICSTAKGMEILISDATLHEHGVQEAFEIEEMAPIILKGFTMPMALYRVKGKKI